MPLFSFSSVPGRLLEHYSNWEMNSKESNKLKSKIFVSVSILSVTLVLCQVLTRKNRNQEHQNLDLFSQATVKELVPSPRVRAQSSDYSFFKGALPFAQAPTIKTAQNRPRQTSAQTQSSSQTDSSKIPIPIFPTDLCSYQSIESRTRSIWDLIKWAKNPQKLFFLLVLLAIIAVTIQFFISAPSLDSTYHRLGYKRIGN